MRGIWNSNDTYLSPRILRALPTTEARPRDCSLNGGDPTVLPMFHRIWGEYDQRCKIVTLLASGGRVELGTSDGAYSKHLPKVGTTVPDMLAAMTFRDFDQAIQLANDSQYRLGLLG